MPPPELPFIIYQHYLSWDMRTAGSEYARSKRRDQYPGTDVSRWNSSRRTVTLSRIDFYLLLTCNSREVVPEVIRMERLFISESEGTGRRHAGMDDGRDLSHTCRQ